MPPADRTATSVESTLSAASTLAALFHDLGKFTKAFDAKLRSNRRSSELWRHELVSYSVVRAMLRHSGSEDECLRSLSDPDTCKALVERAFKDAYADPIRFVSARNTGPEALLGTSKPKSSTKLEAIDKHAPRLTVVGLLILTHHRTLGWNKTFHTASLSPLVSRSGQVAIPEGEFVFPDVSTPLWECAPWVNTVCQAARELSKSTADTDVERLHHAATFGRAALILADRTASRLGSGRLRGGSKSLAYANTSKLDGSLAEQLDGHLSSVAKWTRRSMELLRFGHLELPSVHPDDLSEAISTPRAAKGTPFRWQVEAARLTKSSVEKSPGRGFIGFALAGTGSGKTRVTPIIAAAARPASGMRLTVTSGLRSLTLQSGTEYTTELGFGPADVAVVIGETMSKALYEDARSIHISENEVDALDNVLFMSELDEGERTEAVPITHELPLKWREFGASDGGRDLAAPILVTTVDRLIAAGSVAMSGFPDATARLATSDLAIDEVDDFGNEDQAAILRLVHTAATLGRNVIITTATPSPVLITALQEAYQAGRRVWAYATGNSGETIIGLYGQFEGVSSVGVTASDEFQSRYAAFVGSMIDGMRNEPVRRRMKVLDTGHPDCTEDLFRTVSSGIAQVHADNAIVDPKTGRRFTIGVVRWNNVATSVHHSIHLLGDGLDGLTTKVVPYNGTLFPIVRSRVERTLNQLLNRKSKSGRDPVLSHPLVRSLLDDGGTNDVVIVVVTTSMEEVGRDHDFDWVVSEPCSVRSIIQMAGRLRRHRRVEWPIPNFMIMDRPYGNLRESMEFDCRIEVPLAYPGVETTYEVSRFRSFDVPPSSENLNIALVDRRSSVLLKLPAFEERIDARDVLTSEEPAHPLARSERDLQRAFLIDGPPKDKLNLRGFADGPLSRFTNWHSYGREFRKKTRPEATYILRVNEAPHGWVVPRSQMEGGQAPSKTAPFDRMMTCSRLFSLVEPPTDRLLIDIRDLRGEVVQTLDRMYPGEGGRHSQWKTDSLLTISLERDMEHSYHPLLGVWKS